MYSPGESRAWPAPSWRQDKSSISSGKDHEKAAACKLALEAGAHFVKTSTGLTGGATVADIRLMRQAIGDRMGIKASGGLRTCKDALTMIQAGATRIGTSSGVAMVTEKS